MKKIKAALKEVELDIKTLTKSYGYIFEDSDEYEWLQTSLKALKAAIKGTK